MVDLQLYAHTQKRPLRDDVKQAHPHVPQRQPGEQRRNIRPTRVQRQLSSTLLRFPVHQRHTVSLEFQRRKGLNWPCYARFWCRVLPSDHGPQRGICLTCPVHLCVEFFTLTIDGPDQHPPDNQSHGARRHTPAKHPHSRTAFTPALKDEIHPLPPAVQLKSEHPASLAILLQFTGRAWAKTGYPFKRVRHSRKCR